jgi:acetolactate synthase-1/2/3 large subunit
MDTAVHETTVAERIAKALRRHDVEVIFGQSLPSAVILAAEKIGITQIAYRQENMGGAMADGYARRSGKIGIVAAQNGPAAALLVAPLAEALKASVPVVALVQDVERDQTDRNAFQDLDHIGLFQSCTKWVRRVSVEERIDDYIDAAFTAASSGRAGPAVLLLPADLLRSVSTTPSRRRTNNLGHWPLDRSRPADKDLDIAAKAIANARAPVVIAGGGIHASGAAQQLRLLQDECSIPVFTTNMGKGSVDEWHPLSGGVLASLVGPKSLGRHTVEIVREADLVVLIGTRTNQNGTDNWRQYSPDAQIIHIDTRVAKSHSANARSVTSPAKREIVPAVIVRAVTGLSATSPEAVNPAAGPHRASRPSANPASVANAPVFRARVKAPVAMAPAAASRAAKARVANLLVAGE